MSKGSSVSHLYAPMLAAAAEEPFDSGEHVFEVKWDGIRCLATTGAEGTRLRSRTGRDITRLFPELANAAEAVGGRRAVLDGELCVIDGGRPSFYHIQRRNVVGTEFAIRSGAREHPALYVVFDLLHIDGIDVLDWPWEQRRRRLEGVWCGTDHAVLTDVVPTRGRDLYAACIAQGLEGIVAKRMDSPYIPGRRTHYWLKIRGRRELDAVIGGYVPRGRQDFASLALGLYPDPSGADEPLELRGIPPEATIGPNTGLRYIGNVGTGFPASLRRHLMTLFKELETTEPPFAPPPAPDAPIPAPYAPVPAPDAPIPAPYAPVPAPDAPIPAPYTSVPVPDAPIPAPYAPVPAPDAPIPTDIRWLRPLLVARIQYMKFTPGGRLRHPSFIGLRDDKHPNECTFESQ